MNRFRKIPLISVFVGLTLSILSYTNNPAISAPTLGQSHMFLPVISFDCSAAEIDSNFAYNACGWQARRGEWTVDNDTYSTNGIREQWSTTTYDGHFANLDYRARMKRTGCEFCANQLLIRGEPDPLKRDGTWHNAYAFQFNRDGNFSVWISVDGSPYLPLQRWAFSPAIRQGYAWNELRVVAVNRLLLFYINDEQVWSGLGDARSESQVGIGMYRDADSSGNQLVVDWATLARLPDPGIPDGIHTSELTLSSQINFDEAADGRLLSGE